MKEWDAETGNLARSRAASLQLITCLDLSPDGKWLAAANQNGHVRFWETATDVEVKYKFQGQGRFNFLEFAADSRRVVVGDSGRVKILDRVDTKQEFSQPKIAKKLTAATLGPDGRYIAIAKGNAAVLWDASKSRVHVTLEGAHAGDITAMAFSRNGDRLATGGKDRTLQLWDVETGRMVAPFQGHREALTCIKFSPDEKIIAASCYDGNVYAWGVVSGFTEKVVNLPRFQSPPLAEGVPRISFPDEGTRIPIIQK